MSNDHSRPPFQLPIFIEAIKSPKEGFPLDLLDKNEKMNWQTEGRLAQSQLLGAIPSGWKINHTKHGENVTEAIPGFSILSQKQLQITEMTVTELCPLIASQELTAVEVLQAFAARAAIAHQLVL